LVFWPSPGSLVNSAACGETWVNQQARFNWSDPNIFIFHWSDTEISSVTEREKWNCPEIHRIISKELQRSKCFMRD
jgi:hypothetical protein